MYTVIIFDDSELGTTHRQFFDDFDRACADAVFASTSNDLDAFIYQAPAPLRWGAPPCAPIAQTCPCPQEPQVHIRTPHCGFGPRPRR
ncbi:hypothetical protein [Streptomonospora sp. PA3]|uniref:hypothetical protein n=1 Tax=Streptomonospora sp. PA3 TaxID=2607326 RepID=UPI001CA43E7E|nr:hypothetical protein [Streptomonospora sp. PA3]